MEAINISAQESAPAITNYEEYVGTTPSGKPTTKYRPKDPRHIYRKLMRLLQIRKAELFQIDNCPATVTRDNQVIYLQTAADLIGWIASQNIFVDWREGASMMGKAEFRAFVTRNVNRYDRVDFLPHVPAIATVFYAKKWKAREYTGKLDEIVDLWTPYEDCDRALIKAAFCTPFWGGPAGKRPALFIEKGDPEDPGQGIGKTNLCDAIAEIAGGSVSHTMTKPDTEGLVKRIVNNADANRVIRVDNVKASLISSGDIEDLITAPYVSGHKMRIGEGKVKNLFTWIFTMNGGQLSKDLCQRAIRIKLKRPKTRTPDWDGKLLHLLTKHREDIIGDIIHTLQQGAAALEGKIRFGLWQDEVLAKTTDAADIVQTIIDRQEEVDATDEDAEDFLDMVHVKIRGYTQKLYSHAERERCDPDKYNYLISTQVMANWYREFTGKRMLSNKAATLAVERLRIRSFKRHRVYDGRFWMCHVFSAQYVDKAIKIRTEDRYDTELHTFSTPVIVTGCVSVM